MFRQAVLPLSRGVYNIDQMQKKDIDTAMHIITPRGIKYFRNEPYIIIRNCGLVMREMIAPIWNRILEILVNPKFRHSGTTQGEAKPYYGIMKRKQQLKATHSKN